MDIFWNRPILAWCHTKIVDRSCKFTSNLGSSFKITKSWLFKNHLGTCLESTVCETFARFRLFTFKAQLSQGSSPSVDLHVPYTEELPAQKMSVNCRSTVNWQITDRLQTVSQYQTWMQNIEQKRHILIVKLLSHTSSAWTIVILHSSHRLTGYTSLPIFQMMLSTVSVSQRHSVHWGWHVLWAGLSLTCLFCAT